jgi:hypothetical protein
VKPPRDRFGKVVFLLCGLVVGFVAGFWLLADLAGSLAVALAGGLAIGLLFGMLSVAYGDRAWDGLGSALRWLVCWRP